MFCSIAGRDCDCAAVKETAAIAVPAGFPEALYDAICAGVRDGLGHAAGCQRLAPVAPPFREADGRFRAALCGSRYVIVDVTELGLLAAYVLGAARTLPDARVILIAADSSLADHDESALRYPAGDPAALAALIAAAVRERDGQPAPETIEALAERLTAKISSLENCRLKYTRDTSEIDDWSGQLRKLARGILSVRRAPGREARACAAAMQEVADYLRSPAGAAHDPGAALIADEAQRIVAEISHELDSQRFGENFGALKKILLAVLDRQARAVELAIRAYVAFDADDDPAALELFSRAIALDPRYPQAYLGRGRTRADLRLYQPALADYNRALELDREYAAVHIHRGGAYRNLKEFDKALADYNLALELSPGSPHAYNGRGIVYKALKDRRRAIEEFDRALAADPHYQYALVNRAGTRWELKEYDLALEDFNTALELDPRRAQVYSSRAEFYRSQAEYDKALADINRALEIAPDNSEYLVNRGNIYTDRKQVDRALADYDRAVTIRPESVEPYVNRGAARMQAGDGEGALADFDVAIKLDPNNSQTYNSRAILYCDLKQYDLAIADYHRALEYGPDEGPVYLNLAELFIVLDRFQNALITLQKAPMVDFEINEKAICQYLTCVAKHMLEMDTRDDERRLNALLPKAFNIGWSFADMDRWLAESDIEPAQRSYIINQTEALKAKAVGQ